MQLKLLTSKDKTAYNKQVNHIIQSWEWGEFRTHIGLPVLRFGLFEKDIMMQAFQLTLHQIPFTKQYVGYLPKGPFPDKEQLKALKEIGKQYNCAFIKLEPNCLVNEHMLHNLPKELVRSTKPYFTKYNFLLNLNQTEDELRQNMHPKTRYNINVAQKKGVEVQERDDDKAFDIFLDLYFETTKRQGYHGHNRTYHRKAWETFKKNGQARILIGFFQNKPLSAWMLLNFKDTLYYPYGGSSIEHKEVMANNLVAWEAIRLGKRLRLKTFDMWGASSPDTTPSDPHYGFHRFKQGYGGELVQYIGTYDLVFNRPLYHAFMQVDKITGLKVLLLKLINR